MYLQRYGLKRRPFPTTPDSSLYYPATGHEHSLHQLEQALIEDEGLVLLKGLPGTGKTLLAHCLLERLGEEFSSAFLTNSHFADRAGLLQAVLFDLALPYDGTEQALRLRLTDHLLTGAAEQRQTILIVDEAQHLTAEHAEELRLLGNLEGPAGKAVQVVLLAQPNLDELLAVPEMAAFAQRLAVKAALEPLGLEEALDYLLHHLRWAGGRPEAVIEETALEVLARGARGIPRLLNQVAQQALLLADAAELEIVDAEAALEALAMLGLEAEEVPVVEQVRPAEENVEDDVTFRLAEETRRTA